MPATSQAEHNGRTVTFRESNHSYTDDRGHIYVSVTTLLKDFFEQFDANKNASRMESEGKGEASVLKKQWKQKCEAACRYGTRVHETAEAILAGEKPPHEPESEKERAAFRAVWHYCQDHFLNDPDVKILGSEIMVASQKHYIAGTIDLAIKRGGAVYLFDWKTNEKIDGEGFRGAKAKHPISHLSDCNLTKYSLQLNVYEHILRAEEYITPDTVVKKALLLVRGGEVEPIVIPDLPTETRDVVDGGLDREFAYPPDGGEFTEPVRRESLRIGKAIWPELEKAGWSYSSVFRNKDDVKHPWGKYGFIHAMVWGDRIGAITRDHIEITRRQGQRSEHSHYTNPHLAETLTPEEREAWEERAAIIEFDGNKSASEAEIAAIKMVRDEFQGQIVGLEGRDRLKRALGM